MKVEDIYDDKGVEGNAGDQKGNAKHESAAGKANQDAAEAENENKLSVADGAGDGAPSYYEEESSEYYDEEEEYEEEEGELDEDGSKPPEPQVDGWTEKEGDAVKPVATQKAKKKAKQPKVKKDFDPRTDKMFDINSNEDFLMDSLKNFKPPKETSIDKSHISALENNLGFEGSQITARVVAGVKLRNMVEDNQEDIDEIRQLQDPNFVIAGEE